jgi:hypothetical protein
MQRVRESVISKSRVGLRPGKLVLQKTTEADPVCPTGAPCITDKKNPNRIFLKKSKVVLSKDR